MDGRKSVLAAAVILLVAMAVIVGIYALSNDGSDNGSSGGANQTMNASVTIAFGNGTTWSYDNVSISVANATVYKLTFKAAEAGTFPISSTYYPQYDSHLITAIGGVANGQNDSYWQYTVNGTAGEVGADRHPVANGDHVRWTFKASQFEG